MGSLFTKTGLSPLYDIEMLIKLCVFLEFCVFLEKSTNYYCKDGQVRLWSSVLELEVLKLHGKERDKTSSDNPILSPGQQYGREVLQNTEEIC